MKNKRLATQPSEAIEKQADRQYLTFYLAQEIFAVDILNVKEIIEYGHITEVPMMPAFVRGVINLRGQVVPVIDLQTRFGRKPVPVGKRTCIVIVDVEVDALRQDIGVIVDAVSEVVAIATSDIEKPPGFGAKLRPDFISGMGKLHGKFIVLLQIDNVLSVQDIAQLSRSIEEGDIN